MKLPAPSTILATINMSFKSLHRILILLAPLLLSACAANQLAGFENAYQGYTVPETFVERIRIEFKKNGLPNAQVVRDNVGRIRLTGNYRDEDEVDRAFVIVQSIVGMKSTSPFYPENIQEKRWESDARRALAQFTKNNRGSSAKAVKRALIIGINTFRNREHLPDILGEDDARRVQAEAEKAGYQTTALLGPQATKANIEASIERFKQELGPNDSLLIYISSHGMLPIPSGRTKDARKMSIAAYDTGVGATFSKGTMTADMLKVHDSSVPDTKVQELAQMPTRQTRVIIDTCYSGEILKGIPDESQAYILKTNNGFPERAGISMAAWSGDAYSAKGIFLANDTGTPSAKNQGRRPALAAQKNDINRYTIITATSDGQESWGPAAGGDFESPVTPGRRLQGSFFTQAFFDYLDKYGGHLEPAFSAARQFTYDKVARMPAKSDWKGPVPIQQLPRLNPPLPAGDASSIYD